MMVNPRMSVIRLPKVQSILRTMYDGLPKSTHTDTLHVQRLWVKVVASFGPHSELFKQSLNSTHNSFRYPQLLVDIP